MSFSVIYVTSGILGLESLSRKHLLALSIAVLAFWRCYDISESAISAKFSH